MTETAYPKHRRVLIAVLYTLLIISLGINLSLYSKNVEYTKTIADISRALENQNPLMVLRNMTMSNPETRYLQGTRIVSGSRLHLLKDRLNNRCSCEDDIAFYVPYKNASLEMRFYLKPSEGYSQGLYLQRGDAYRNESGILVSGNPDDEQVIFDGVSTYFYNMTVWQSPVIWETEARNGEKYMVELTDEGWYTLSLWSPVCFSAGTLEKSGSMILEDNHTLPYPDVIDSWVEFRVTRDGEPLLLLLKYN